MEAISKLIGLLFGSTLCKERRNNSIAASFFSLPDGILMKKTVLSSVCKLFLSLALKRNLIKNLCKVTKNAVKKNNPTISVKRNVKRFAKNETTDSILFFSITKHSFASKRYCILDNQLTKEQYEKAVVEIKKELGGKNPELVEG
ncbi:MAG: hypothetical protein HYY87_00700 [Candidatus Levybacteria bacterium]|nr:hypothetical protein [Candidatus Levybacteria bacterium]